LTDPSVNSLAVSGTDLFAGTSGGVFLSTNNGASWTAVNTGLTDPSVRSLAVSGTDLFAGTSGGVFLSTNNGASWTAVNTGLTNPSVNSLAVSGTDLFAGTSGDVFLSTNNGASWTAVNTGLTNPVVMSLAFSGTNLFAGTLGGVYLSTNNGTSWTAVNTGLASDIVSSLAVSGTNLFAGTNGGVWRRPLSEMITSVEVISSLIPSCFDLKQNYPNPFNPSTTIEFSVPMTAFVSLKVFDALGRDVATLLSEQFSAGTYSTQWNAEGVPSGVYFYQLQAGAFIHSKRLIVLR
jgi:ligand-binding sensor domain-containing protein